MNTNRSIAAGLLILACCCWPSAGNCAATETDYCADFPPENNILVPNNFSIGLIRDSLKHYSTIKDKDGITEKFLHKSGEKEVYCLIFDISESINGLDAALTLNTVDDRDVVIKHLNIKSLDSGKSLLEISHNMAGTVQVLDSTLQNVRSGIMLTGTGSILVQDASIIGRAQLEACIKVDAPNALFDKIKAQHCATGILVGAPNVKITNSEITDNGTGVRIASGILGTELLTNKIFDNVEGIVFADGQPNELVFFDGDEQSFAPAEAGEDGAIDYGDQPVYINVVLNGASSSEKPVKVEFFLSKEGQAKEPISCVSQTNKGLPGPIVVPAIDLAKTPITCTLPAEHRLKKVVSMLTDPRYGTTGVSQEFSCKNCEVVTFVSSPFDMPTSGMDGAGTSGEEVEVGSGGGEVVGGAMSAGGPKGCGGQLAPGGAARTVDVAMSLWWIILAGAVMGGMRLASPRGRQHH